MMVSFFFAAATAGALPMANLSDPRFKGAIEIAARRPVPKTEIRLLSMRHKNQTVSVAMFNRLAHGLDLMIHTLPGTADTDELSEGGVDLHGLASLTYWNSRFQRSGWPQSSSITEVRLVDGAAYSDNSSYTLHHQFEGDAYEMTCRPKPPVEARTLHSSLTGQATEFSCEAPTQGVKSRMWYLKDYARYVTLYSEFDGEVMLDASIHEVQFAL
jgi:hypothetical protein